MSEDSPGLDGILARLDQAVGLQKGGTKLNTALTLTRLAIEFKLSARAAVQIFADVVKALSEQG